MRKQLVIILTLLAFSIVVHAQTNTIYGKDVVISTRDTSSAELTIKNSTRTVQGYLKNASGTGKTMFAFPAWSEITSKPSNFNTTYALSNDVKDSILKRVAIRDTSAMLNPYKLGIIALNADTATLSARFSNVVSLVGTKLNWSDTSSMLNAYKLKDIAHDASLALKINFTDSAGMLNAYRLKDISHDASITALNNDTGTLAARFTNVINLANSRQAALGFTPENAANRNAANGYAGLDAGGKVPFSLLPAALMIYKGTWNASTNTPTLSDGTGTSGWVYIVSTGGTVNTGSGSITYSAGDYAIHNGSIWQRSVGTNNVSSVNGQQGVVTLSTSNIAEGSNLYYTDARARASITLTTSGSSGAATYSGGTLNIPTYTLAGLGGVSLSGSYADPSWITSLNYSKLTGTVPTWNQNTTGNAATATLAANSTQWNAQNYDGSLAMTSAPDYIMGYQTSTNKWKPITAAALQSFAGLGSYAYRSSGLAELSGASFTGAISAIGATFSASVDMGFNNQITFGTAPYKFKINRNSAGNLDTYFDDEYDVDNTSLKFRFRTLGTPITALKLLSTGAVSMPTNISSTSTSSGTLVVGGGVGIAGAVNVGGIVSASGNIVTSGNLTTAAYIYGQTTNSVIRLDNTIGALIGYSSTYNNYAYFDANGGGIITNGITRFTINNSGVATLANLAGTGDRMVVVNSSGQLSATNAAPGVVLSGTYTPTITNQTNASGTGGEKLCHYTRIGNEVTVWGRFTRTVTSANTYTLISMSLPIASNLTGTEALVGTGVGGANWTDGVEILKFSGEASFNFYPAASGGNEIAFSFTYTVN